MGLIEKRLIKEAKESWLPGEQKDIQDVAGAPIVVDVDWPTFETDEAALKNVQHLGVRKLANAFRVICVDELGKEAVRDGVKRIVVTNQKEGAPSVVLDNSVVTLACVFAKGSDGCLTDLEIAKILTRAL
ncbi:hypothetical protein [Polyangium mundeleinium]|uniref:Uncharacterized protein n=1 Tax=Polyangium mundeleinium TaxID=2995306 RepID=A0ABT5EP95_9BACT|nr:hypothetical protein [Polyangium mundeleinium]MDC0743663.1 hypothetical protein [Polyangium mundeleinium]